MIDTVVANKREGLSYYLSVIARVGESFLIACETRRENDLTDHSALGTEAPAFEYLPVGKHKISLFAHVE